MACPPAAAPAGPDDGLAELPLVVLVHPPEDVVPREDVPAEVREVLGLPERRQPGRGLAGPPARAAGAWAAGCLDLREGAVGGEGLEQRQGLAARKVSGWPKRCKLAHAFLQEYTSLQP
jgi:hypothetical protein